MSEKKRVAVIGGGASGLMCAYAAAQAGASVMVFEKNKVCGRKLSITGKGRCNVTNNCNRDVFLSNVVRNPRFLYSAWYAFDSQSVISFFESLGVPLKTERGNRVFPVSDRASDIVSALVDACQKVGVQFVHRDVRSVEVSEHHILSLSFSDGHSISADSYVLATGGKSYPVTGSDGCGYRFAECCGHSIVSPHPSLVGWLVSEQSLCADAQGLSLKNVSLKLLRDGKVLRDDFGEMLFTHYGLSGPMVLSASAFLKPNDILSIDLKPALSISELDFRVLEDLKKYSKKNLDHALEDLLPLSLIHPFLESLHLDCTKKAYSISKEERRSLVSTMKDFRFTALAPRSFEEAIITAGGVNTEEVNPKTMKSKLCDNLYFCGEILDVDALTGGFNLQIAFSTGHLAGVSCAQQ